MSERMHSLCSHLRQLQRCCSLRQFVGLSVIELAYSKLLVNCRQIAENGLPGDNKFGDDADWTKTSWERRRKEGEKSRIGEGRRGGLKCVKFRASVSWSAPAVDRFEKQYLLTRQSAPYINGDNRDVKIGLGSGAGSSPHPPNVVLVLPPNKNHVYNK